MKNVKKRTILFIMLLLCTTIWGCGKNESTEVETIVEVEEQTTVEQNENSIEFSDSYIQEEQNEMVDTEEEEVDIETEIIWKPNDTGITKKRYLAVNRKGVVWCEYIYEEGKLKRYFEYDELGKIHLIEEYDNHGNIDRIFENMRFRGNKIKYEYDEQGNVISANINGEISKYEYDEQGKCIAKQRYISENDLKENKIWDSYIYKYYPSGIPNKILQEDNVGNPIIFKYLYYPNITYVQTERKAFDNICICDIRNSRITSGEFTDGVLVVGEEAVFDEKGNIVKIISISDYNEPAKTKFEYVYDESGRVIEKISYYREIWRDFFEYDSEGKLIRLFSTEGDEGNGIEYIYEYDDEGRLVKVIDDNRKESGITIRHEFGYDEYGNRDYECETQVVSDDGRGRSFFKCYGYDSEGRIVSAFNSMDRDQGEIFYELPDSEDETE